MVRDFSSTAMVVAMKEDLHSTRKRAMESFPGSTVEYSMDIGKMVYNMVRVHTLMQMGELNGVYGTKDQGLNSLYDNKRTKQLNLNPNLNLDISTLF